MNNFNKTDLNEELWLEVEKIRETLSLMLEKLRKVNDSLSESLGVTEVDFSSLLKNIQSIIDTQSTLLNDDLASKLNDITSVITNQTDMLGEQVSSKATEITNAISVQTTTLTQSIQTQISSLYSQIQTLLNSLNQKVVENGTNISSNGTQIGVLQQDVLSLQTSLSEILSVVKFLSGGGKSQPFILDFSTVYGSETICDVSRSYSETSTITTSQNEPFIVNANTPVLILISFDFYTPQEQDVTFSFYINNVINDTITKHFTAGTTAFSHQIAFMSSQSNNVVYVSAVTEISNTKTIRNLKYKVVANNALLLNESPSVVYHCWPVGTQIYVTKREKDVCMYKVLDMTNLDFSGNYTTIHDFNNEDIYAYPIMLFTVSSGVVSFNQYAYAGFNTITNKLITYNNADAEQKTLDLIYNSYAPRYVNILSCYDSSYTSQIHLLYPQEPRGRRFRTYSGVKNCISSQNYTHENVPVQVLSPTICTIKNGIVTGMNDYVVFQRTNGKWFINTVAKLASNREDSLELGFGTRANFAFCPPLAQNSVENHVYFRVFLCAYGTWYAYYIDYDKPNTTWSLLKTEVVQGDFDQLLAGNANLYFGVKNGSFTAFYDATFKSITEF